MRRPMIALVVMFSLVAVPAFAERFDNYGKLKLGVYSPRSYNLKASGYGNGFGGEFAYGRYFTRYLAGEAGIGYFKTTNEIDEITVYPLTVTGKGILPLGEVELYAGAGGGAYFAQVESVAGSGQNLKDTAPGWHVLVGGNWNVMPRMLVGVEIRYTWVEPSFGASEPNLGGFTTTANLGFRF